MMILNAVAVLFNYSGLELIVKEDFDLNKELRLTGYNNMVAGLAGTPAGYMTLSETSMSYNLGARSRLPSIVVAVFCTVTLIFGAKVLSIFPKVILGGLLLNLGLEFLMEWLYDTRKRLQKTDYTVIALILIVIGSIGFLEGIVLGLLMSIVLFVINYSKVEVIKYQLTGKTFSSNVERSSHLKQILDDHGDEIYILPLQGFIFFGTSNRLLQQVQMRLEDSDLGPLHYLVFDFRHVTGLDSSAINSFNKLQIMAENSRFRVLLCGLQAEMESQLKIEGLISNDNTIIQVFVDLDHGLEWCEEQIILTVLPDAGDVARTDKGDSFKEKFPQIAEYFDTRKIPAGTAIINQGENPGGITFIESGQITVELKTNTGKKIRLKTLGPGTVVGEVSLYLGTKASASVLANTECKVFFLARENFERMNLEAPEKAAELHSYIVKLLSDRLAGSNATIQALMR
jgi:SulP family sulfate permease